ncbi:hypothetical protein HELRODRAFT_163794 [Helobdella robusta]|uniref:Uncharacterized protein n=1 Tax=Helobdella robusta TaxID=6412 RepID=T1EUH4_HELRO|nr:hypothetical protein HELRODRAFT_163794 [Helobdella robusta]ESN96698.1 hypothetical protein HELRODRAFT_163794 [Helobdella robusta]
MDKCFSQASCSIINRIETNWSSMPHYGRVRSDETTPTFHRAELPTCGVMHSSFRLADLMWTPNLLSLPNKPTFAISILLFILSTNPINNANPVVRVVVGGGGYASKQVGSFQLRNNLHPPDVTDAFEMNINIVGHEDADDIEQPQHQQRQQPQQQQGRQPQQQQRQPQQQITQHIINSNILNDQSYDNKISNDDKNTDTFRMGNNMNEDVNMEKTELQKVNLRSKRSIHSVQVVHELNRQADCIKKGFSKCPSNKKMKNQREVLA